MPPVPPFLLPFSSAFKLCRVSESRWEEYTLAASARLSMIQAIL